MGLIYRTSSLANVGASSIKNAELTYQEGDGNIAFLLTNLSGSNVSIDGNTTMSGPVQVNGAIQLDGNVFIPNLTSTSQNSLVTYDSATGRFYYTASSAIVTSGSLFSNTASFVTASNVYGPFGSNSIVSSSFAISASWAPSSLIGGTQYRLPVWTGATTLGTSSLYESGSVLKTIYNNNDEGIVLDSVSREYYLGNKTAGDGILVDINNGIIKSQYGNADVGIKIDMVNGQYQLGQILTNNQTTLTIDDTNGIVKTQYATNDIGLKLDFANDFYLFGDYTSNSYLVSDAVNIGISIGDYYGNGNYTEFNVNDTNSIIKSTYNQNDIGLKLDFANNEYSLGDSGSIGNGNKLIIDNLGGQITLSGNNNNQGLYVAHALSGRKTTIGDYSDTNNSTKIVVDDSDQTVIISGSTILSGSLFVNNLTTGSTSDVLTYNSSTGQVFFTASSAIGGVGGPTPTLQQVTTAGSSSANTIVINGSGAEGIDILDSVTSQFVQIRAKEIGITFQNSLSSQPYFQVEENGIDNGIAEIRLGGSGISQTQSVITNANLTGIRTHYLPNESGTLVLKVNGVSADASGSITIPTGTTIATGSFLTTGSLSTTQQLSGSLNVTGSLNFFSGSTNATKIENGWVVLSQVSMSLDFANDAAAAAGGVPLGGLYRNGNAISIRIV